MSRPKIPEAVRNGGARRADTNRMAGPADRTPARRTVLLVDDAEWIRRLVEARLAKEDVTVVTAGDGEEGVEEARRLLPDLILLDVEMPKLDGFAACRRLKDDALTADIPIIFLTGTQDTEEKIRGLDMGAVDYIVKPFDTAELRARVRAALRTKRLMDLLAEKAQIDGLTGLRNRGYLNERLDAFAAQHRRGGPGFGVLMCDIDHFKKVNDTYGHGFGDEVLVAVADAARNVCRVEDIVCRYGGEEICVLAPGIGAEGSCALAERLREAVEALPLTFDGRPVHVTLSVGIAATGDVPGAAADVVRRADAALYRAKRDGRNRVACGGADPAAVRAA